ncbi:MAG: RNA polymerase sigma factor [Pseudomonadota bacterium]
MHALIDHRPEHTRLPEPRRCIAPRLQAVTSADRPERPYGQDGMALSAELKQDLIAMLPRLRRFARSLTRSVPEADDLVQEACLRAIARADQWDRSQPLDRWMFRITRNLWISELRKQQVRMGEGQVAAEETHELRTLETGEAQVVASQLRGLIAALPGDLAPVLLAVSVEGFSYAEAADLFEIPIGTVMSRVHRARKILAANIAATGGDSR